MVRVLMIICMACVVLTASGQETLNVHTKDNGIVSIPFSKKPEMSFGVANKLKIVSSDKTLEFAFADIEKLSFDNSSSDDIHLIRHHGSQSGISIYDLSGKLVRKADSSDGVSTLDMQSLPPGVYIVKDGSKSYKLINNPR